MKREDFRDPVPLLVGKCFIESLSEQLPGTLCFHGTMKNGWEVTGLSCSLNVSLACRGNLQRMPRGHGNWLMECASLLI